MHSSLRRTSVNFFQGDSEMWAKVECGAVIGFVF